MNRTEKETTVQALHEKLAKATFVAAVSFTKLDANTAIELRKAMRAAKVDYKVVKNTLAKKAAKGTPAEKLDAQFEGPVAVAIGYDDMIVSAKSITEFFKKAPEGTLKIKAAVADNAALDAAGVAARQDAGAAGDAGDAARADFHAGDDARAAVQHAGLAARAGRAGAQRRRREAAGGLAA